MTEPMTAHSAAPAGAAKRAPRAFRGAIVDLDGTLIDTLGDFVAALGGMLGELGLPALAPAQVRRMVGKGSEHLVRTALGQALHEARGAAPAAAELERLFPAALARYMVHYRAHNGAHATVYPGAAQALQELGARGWRLTCLTNKPLVLARALLAAKGLDGHFQHIFGGDSFAVKKPHPLPVQEACRALGLAAHEVLMLGDSSNDAEAARAAGCAVLLVRYGYNHGQALTAESADLLVDSLAPCAPWLEALAFG